MRVTCSRTYPRTFTKNRRWPTRRRSGGYDGLAGCSRCPAMPARLHAAPVTMPNDLVVLRPQRLYCPAGDFYIDPWRPWNAPCSPTRIRICPARFGHYLAHTDSAGTLRNRLGADITLQTLAYGEAITHQGVTVSLHPAGHVLARPRCASSMQARCGWPRATTSSKTTAPAPV